ncbi:hypothetical protein JO972_07275 [Verrucomicrobiaceae bacterium 5K15]|uniref:Lipoprotein n=1 Tax=Oceaniferula flava TaxID=2800421 RepID=A0AAE2SD96_9BACT|nr:hypothetical protein [Oceaniferula flavus]MBK1854754.1 hypothetical protein [Oceaniferula flavus]MBM1136060.1 hypothetical protein [Oceaniferula flavus]
MKISVACIALTAFLLGCEKREETVVSAAASEPRTDGNSRDGYIRVIRTYGTDDNFGIELNGDEAFLRQDAHEPKRREISFSVGEKLVEEFYSIKDLERFSGSKISNQRTDTHLWINVFDERPDKYSEDWVAYAIPNELLDSDVPIAKWVKSLDSMRSDRKSEQDAVSNP